MIPKQDIETAKKALKQYLDVEIEGRVRANNKGKNVNHTVAPGVQLVGVIRRDENKLREELDARTLAIYMACARRDPSWTTTPPSMKRRALQKVTKMKLHKIFKKYSHNSPAWHQKVQQFMPSEEDIEFMVNTFEDDNDSNSDKNPSTTDCCQQPSAFQQRFEKRSAIFEKYLKEMGEFEELDMRVPRPHTSVFLEKYRKMISLRDEYMQIV
jgi:hypothetical protein